MRGETVTPDEKLDKVYEMAVEVSTILPNLVTRIECFERHSITAKRVDRVYIIAAAISGTFSFLGVVVGFLLKAKGFL